MYRLKIHSNDDCQMFTPRKNAILIDVLRQNDMIIRKGCAGNGACGLCKLKIIDGKINPLTQSEQLHLTHTEISNGIRLACQVTLQGDLEIELLDVQSSCHWKFKGIEQKVTPQERGHPLGIAVDLGTTHIRISICSLKTGKRLSNGYCLNPQMIYGSDIMTRLQSAVQSDKIGQTMSQVLIDAIGEGIWRSCLEAGMRLDAIQKVFLVGNTAMITLLTGKGHHDLLQPENWHRHMNISFSQADQWKPLWGLSDKTQLEIIPSLSGFVGSDLLAGILSTNLMEGKQKKMLVDFGTNSEIALWDSNTLWVTSAAGGPAFEGSGMSCGMPAEKGAVYQTSIANQSITYKVIGQQPPRGICGSGTVDLIADLLTLNIVLPTGRFNQQHPTYYKLLNDQNDPIKLTKADIDLFQRAKSAVATGISVLIKQAGMTFSDLDSLYLGGAFGRFLNIQNAIAVGLIPPVATDKVLVVEDMAMKGCEKMLMNSKWKEQISVIKEQAIPLNLSRRDDFYDLFLQNLFLSVLEDVS